MLTAERLKQIRESKGLSVKDMALNLNMSDRTLGSYEREERQPSAELIESLITQMQCNPKWLFTGEGEMYVEEATQSTSLVDQNECANVPLFEVSAGGGINMDEFNTYPIPLEEIKKFRVDLNNIAVARVYGYSMEPLISENDYILVELNPQRIYTYEVYILSYEDEFYCKRIVKNVTEFILESDNTKFPPVTISGQEREKLNIFGRVLYRMGTVAKVR